ncbi:MAG: SLC13 family permease [Chloroflexota bacterium]
MNRFWGCSSLLFLLCIGGSTLLPPAITRAAESSPQRVIIGTIYDSQGNPIEGVSVIAHASQASNTLAEAETQSNGIFSLELPEELPPNLSLTIERAHFKSEEVPIQTSDLSTLKNGGIIALPEIILDRHIGIAFWVATVIFIIMLVLIASEKFHNTLAALLGVTLVFVVSYLGRSVSESLYIYDFKRALTYVDWNVIFLILGMMIYIAMVEKTGIFQWTALWAYRISRGRLWLLMPVLMLFTGIASAFLDNVTTMLLMTPITVQISLAMGINPMSLLIPEVMASNVIGISTLIGTPTNILIGSYAHISFSDFLKNLTPGVLLAFLGLIIYSEFTYRRELKKSSNISTTLLEKLTEHGRITEPQHLKKAGWVGLGMIILFVLGEKIHLVPAVTALLGATTLLVWIKPDLEEMIAAVDWTTLVFFLALFMVVGAIQEVGLVSIIAGLIRKLIGENKILAMFVVIWASASLSIVIANIPFTAAMLPVIGYLTKTIPSVHTKVLFYCLSVGSAFGGNGSLIGASANMVTAGIADRAGYPVTYMYFLKKGLPALIITVALANIWLLLHFF